MTNNEEFRFNLEIFRKNGSKEIKLANVPVKHLKAVLSELSEKYG